MRRLFHRIGGIKGPYVTRHPALHGLDSGAQRVYLVAHTEQHVEQKLALCCVGMASVNRHGRCKRGRRFRQIRAKHVGGHAVPCLKQGDLLDYIFQLTHIPRPRVMA